MNSRIRVLLASLGLLGALLVPALASAPPAGAVISCGASGYISWRSGLNATGHYLYTCAYEYPGTYTWCSFDQPSCRFEDGSYPDNRIESVDFTGAHSGACVSVWTGYYFGGSRGNICKPSSGSQVVNFGGVFYNGVSSLLSCGFDGCADNP